jgi:Tfp pilus assembly protein PilF
MRVTGELTEGASERLLLPIRIEAPVEKLFDVQLQVASDVITRLTDRTDAASDGQLGGTRNLTAYDAFLRGLELYEAGIDENSDRAALALFEEAIRLDDRFAAAHAMRGRTLALLGNLYAGSEDRADTYGAAAESAQRAIEIAPEFPNGHAVLGFVMANGQLDMRSAVAPYDRAFELGNGDANILSHFAIFRSRVGDPERARRAIERARVLDPLNARVYRFAANIAYQAREYDRAEAEMRRAGNIQPGISSFHYLVGLTQLARGELEAAKASFENDKFFVWRKTGLAIVEEKLGNKTAAEDHLSELRSRQGDKSNYQYLQIHAQWGDVPAALDAMDAAWTAWDSGLVQLHRDPLLDPLRESERYRRLVARIGFI